jgi:lipopolysaccharide export system protein LptC
MRKRRAAQKPIAASAASGGTAPDLRFLTAATASDAVRSASLYSRFVRAMKLALPAAAALLFGAILLWPHFQAERNRFHVAISGIDPRHPDRLRVVNARFRGTDKDQQPYMVTAESAHETDPGSRRIALETPAADLGLKDGGWVIARAPEGTYDRDHEVLDLTGGVSVFHDNGYAFFSNSARVILHQGRAEGEEPAIAHGPLGEVKGDAGYVIVDKGRRILFKGKSRLVLRPGVKTDGTRK